jgi:hypothetical protein
MPPTFPQIMHNAGGVMVRFADGAAGGDEVGLEV